MNDLLTKLFCFFAVFSSLTGAAESMSGSRLTSMELVTDMGVGWNLGNSLDAKGRDETVWGNPKTTKELINAIRKKGFRTLRVPVTWQYHTGDEPAFRIEEKWLNRVEEIVNYGLTNDMYVIINVHHDEEWLVPTYAEVDNAKDRLKKVWTQIASRFKKYGERLVFETLNEPRLKNSPKEWAGGTDEGRDCVNQFNKVAVDAIRATAGNNAWRHVMVPTYGASTTQNAIEELVLPKSPNIIVSIHNYFPFKFCLGKKRSDWGSDADKKALDDVFDQIVATFVSKGIPVVIGEWGSLNQCNQEDRVRHATYYVNVCRSRGICPIWWDNGFLKEFGIIDRRCGRWVYPSVATAIVNEEESDIGIKNQADFFIKQE